MKTKKMVRRMALAAVALVTLFVALGPQVEIRLNPPQKAEAATSILSRERSQAQELRAKGVELLNSALLDQRELDKAREAKSLLYDAEQLHPDEAQRFTLRVYQFMASDVLGERFERFQEDERETVNFLLNEEYPDHVQHWIPLIAVIEKGPPNNGYIAHVGSPWTFPMLGAYQALGWGTARSEWMRSSGATYATALSGIVRKGEKWGALAYGVTREPEILARAVGPTGKVFGSELNDDQLGHLEDLNKNRSTDCAEMVAVKAELDRCTLAGRNLDGIAIHQFLHIWGTSIGPEGQYDVQRVGAYFRTVRDALRPGGKLIVLDSNPSREVARAIMEEAGLHEVSFGSPDSNSDYHQGGTYRAVYQRP